MEPIGVQQVAKQFAVTHSITSISGVKTVLIDGISLSNALHSSSMDTVKSSQTSLSSVPYLNGIFKQFKAIVSSFSNCEVYWGPITPDDSPTTLSCRAGCVEDRDITPVFCSGFMGSTLPYILERAYLMTPGTALIVTSDYNSFYGPSPNLYIVDPRSITHTPARKVSKKKRKRGETTPSQPSVTFSAVLCHHVRSHLAKTSSALAARAGRPPMPLDYCEIALMSGALPLLSNQFSSIRLVDRDTGQVGTVGGLLAPPQPADDARTASGRRAPPPPSTTPLERAVRVYSTHGGVRGLLQLASHPDIDIDIATRCYVGMRQYLRYDRSVPLQTSPSPLLSRIPSAKVMGMMKTDHSLPSRPPLPLLSLAIARLAQAGGISTQIDAEPSHPYRPGSKPPRGDVDRILWILNLPPTAKILSPHLPTAAALLYMSPVTNVTLIASAVAAATITAAMSVSQVDKLCAEGVIPRTILHQSQSGSVVLAAVEMVSNLNLIASLSGSLCSRTEPRVLAAVIAACLVVEREGKLRGKEAVTAVLDRVGLGSGADVSAVYDAVVRVHSRDAYAFLSDKKEKAKSKPMPKSKAMCMAQVKEVVKKPTPPASKPTPPASKPTPPASKPTPVGPTVSPLYPALPPLPADAVYADILRSVIHEPVTLISGATGSGKSSRVPLMLLSGWRMLNDEKRKSEQQHLSASSMPLSSQVFGLHSPPPIPTRPRMLIVEPRRLAAIGLCLRVKDEVKRAGLPFRIGFCIGGEVEGRDSADILFCTSGWLLQKLLHQPSFLGGFSALVLDEVHERNVDADILSSLLHQMQGEWRGIVGRKTPAHKESSQSRTSRRPRKRGWDSPEEEPALSPPFPHILLMSATLDMGVMSSYFSATPVVPIHCGGKCYPVQKYTLNDIVDTLPAGRGKQAQSHGRKRLFESNIISQAKLAASKLPLKGTGKKAALPPAKLIPEVINLVTSLALSHIRKEGATKGQKAGSVLVFLPGLQSIEDLHDRIGTQLGRGAAKKPAVDLIILHSLIPFDEQTEALTSGGQRIYLSTNIAQTSLTLPDVTVVIDTCQQRHMSSHQLTTIWISQADCLQRAGRAGRVRPGTYYSMCTREMYGVFRQHQLAEIHCSPLEDTLLNLYSVQETATAAAEQRLERARSGGEEERGMEISALPLLFSTPDPPAVPVVQGGLMKLGRVGAINTALTEHGGEVSPPDQMMKVIKRLSTSQDDVRSLLGLRIELTMLGTLLAALPMEPDLSTIVALALFSEVDDGSTTQAYSVTPSILVGLVATTLSIKPYRGRHNKACSPVMYLNETGSGTDAQLRMDPICSDVLSDIQAVNTYARLKGKKGKKGIALHRECLKHGISSRQARRLQLHSANAAQSILQWARTNDIRLVGACRSGLQALASQSVSPGITDLADHAEGARALFHARLVLSMGALTNDINQPIWFKVQKGKGKGKGKQSSMCDKLVLSNLPPGSTAVDVELAVGAAAMPGLRVTITEELEEPRGPASGSGARSRGRGDRVTCVDRDNFVIPDEPKVKTSARVTPLLPGEAPTPVRKQHGTLPPPDPPLPHWRYLSPATLPQHIARVNGLMVRGLLPMPGDMGPPVTTAKVEGCGKVESVTRQVFGRSLPFGCIVPSTAALPIGIPTSKTLLDGGMEIVHGLTLLPPQTVAGTGIIMLVNTDVDVKDRPVGKMLLSKRGGVVGFTHTSKDSKRDSDTFSIVPSWEESPLPHARLLASVNAVRMAHRSIWRGNVSEWSAAVSDLNSIYTSIYIDMVSRVESTTRTEEDRVASLMRKDPASHEAQRTLVVKQDGSLALEVPKPPKLPKTKGKPQPQQSGGKSGKGKGGKGGKKGKGHDDKGKDKGPRKGKLSKRARREAEEERERKRLKQKKRRQKAVLARQRERQREAL